MFSSKLSSGLFILFFLLLTFSSISNASAFFVIPTTSPQARRNIVNSAYNKDKDELLVVWKDKRNDPGNLWDNITDYGFKDHADIYGRIVKPNGTLVSGEFPIASKDVDEQDPFVIYNSTRKEFVVFIQRMDDLVVTDDNRLWEGYCYNIGAYRISTTGTVLGNELTVSDATGCQWYPRADYNPDTNTLLVAYHDFRNWANLEKAIYGRIIGYDNSGNLQNIGDELFLTRDVSNSQQEAKNYQQYSSVVYNKIAHKYLVVWGDDRKNKYTGAHTHAYDLFGQFIDQNSNFVDPNKEIYSNSLNQHFPAVTFNPVNNEYLLSYLQDPASQTADKNEIDTGIPYLLKFNTIDSPLPTDSAILLEQDTSYTTSRPSLACNNFNGNCLIVWVSLNRGGKIYGRFLNKNGSLSNILDLSDNLPYSEDNPWVSFNENPAAPSFSVSYGVLQSGTFGNVNLITVADNSNNISTPTPPQPTLIKGWNKFLWNGFTEVALPVSCSTYSYRELDFWKGKVVGFGLPVKDSALPPLLVLCK